MVATDSIKNIVNIIAAQHVEAETEAFVGHVAALFLERYAQVASVTVEALETRWLRRDVDGAPHAHTFTLDGNGQPFVRLVARPAGRRCCNRACAATP